MELKEAINILKLHNKWRRGMYFEMQNPKQIGIAIDVIVEYFKNKENGKRSN